MLLKTLGLVVLSITLTACNITGSAQKGPFKDGSAISASQLDSQGSPVSSSTINTNVSGSQGGFSVDRIRWSGWTELVASGRYFDEFANIESSTSITLNAITKKDRRFDTANINLLTHFAAARIRQLLASGQNRNNAWRNTQAELKQQFGFIRISQNFNSGVEQLDLLSGSGSFRKDNANLLLFTGAFLATDSISSLQSLTDDFADDGQFNGAGVDSFNNIAAKAGEDGLLDLLSNNLKSRGVNNPPNSGDLSSLPDWVNTDVVVTDITAPVITVTGQDTVTIVVGTPYNDEGATAQDETDGEVAATAVDESDVIDTSEPTTHIVTYSATDIAGNTSEAIRTVIVSPIQNNAPVAVDQVIEVVEDTIDNVITLIGSDADIDTSLVFTNTNPSNGTLSGVAPNLAYTPNANYFGLDSFSFTVSDGIATDTATISITVTDVAEPNNTPVADAQSITVAEDTTDNVITLTGSDADIDTSLTFTNTSPSNGTLSGVAPNLAYTPNANYFGSDSFSFMVSDGIATDTALISITVTDVAEPNNAPVAEAQSVTVAEDTINYVITLTGSDADIDTSLTFTNTNPSNGILSGVAPNLAYTPNANYFGSDSFSFTVNDGISTDTATISIIVIDIAEPNNAPVAEAQSITVAEDTINNVITLTGSDADIDTSLTFTNTNPSNGTLSGVAPNLTYTPAVDFFGSDSFDFTVSDGIAAHTATVSITVTDVEEPTPTIPEISQADIDEYLTVINAARAESRFCGATEQTYPAVDPVTWSDKLYMAAYEHSQDMAISDTFSHDGSGTESDWTGYALNKQSNMQERVASYDYQWIRLAENITAGTRRDTAHEAVESWLTSDTGHCESMMNPVMTEVGMAFVSNPDLLLTNFWTQKLGRGLDLPISQSSINARITTASGEVISDVIIEATSSNGSTSATSNTEGVVNLDLIAGQGYILKLDKEGFATQVLPVTALGDGEVLNLNVTMIERGDTKTFDAGVGDTIVGNNGASVTIAQDSFINAAGEVVTGEISVTVTPVDVSNPATLAAFPGEFTGIQTDSSVTPIISLGTVEYKFTQNGEELQLGNGATADILIPIYIPTYQNGTNILVGEEIPLWSLNEVTGIWLQEGVGTVVVSDSSPTGLAMLATVNHFTWWNCDVPMGVGRVNVSVTGPDISAGSVLVIGTAAQSCAIGWNTPASITVAIGGTRTLKVPSSCEVCYKAEWSQSQTGVVSSNVECGIVSPNGMADINLTFATTGPLNIVANNLDEPETIDAVIGFASRRVLLSSTTLESSVVYSVITGALPDGLSLRSRNGTQSEIVGLPTSVGDFSVVIQGEDSTGETDTVTINYTILDPNTVDRPLFSHEFLYLPFDNKVNSRDLALYNIGSDATSWSLEEAYDFYPIPSWLNINSSTGVLSIVGEVSQPSEWIGSLRVQNGAGSTTVLINICTIDCGSPSPLPGDYALNIESYTSGTEEEGSILFPITLNQAVPRDITVNYQTVDGTALAGSDYVSTTSSIVILSGETLAFIAIDIVRDEILEDNSEVFYLDISTPDDLRVENGRGVGYISDFILIPQ